MNNLFGWFWNKKKKKEIQYSYKAMVVDVYDGDTITVNIEIANIDLGFGLHLNLQMKGQKLRLYGLNTPEVTGIEKEEGLKSKEWLSKKLLRKCIVFDSTEDKKGKYGRWLATITHVDNVELETSINDQLISEGLAKKVNY